MGRSPGPRRAAAGVPVGRVADGATPRRSPAGPPRGTARTRCGDGSLEESMHTARTRRTWGGGRGQSLTIFNHFFESLFQKIIGTSCQYFGSTRLGQASQNLKSVERGVGSGAACEKKVLAG